MQLKEFDGKKLICVLKEGLELEETEEEQKVWQKEVAPGDRVVKCLVLEWVGPVGSDGGTNIYVMYLI